MYIYIIRLKFVLGNFILPSTGFQISLYIYKNGRTDERWTIYITTRTKERADELTNRLLTNRREKNVRAISLICPLVHPSIQLENTSKPLSKTVRTLHRILPARCTFSSFRNQNIFWCLLWPHVSYSHTIAHICTASPLIHN